MDSECFLLCGKVGRRAVDFRWVYETSEARFFWDVMVTKQKDLVLTSRKGVKVQLTEEIYEMYSRKVFLFLLSKTNNEQLAEELTQETFFQAVQCIDRFKGNSSVLTWLCGIAKNVWLKYLRKHQEILSMEDCALEIEDKREINVQWEQKEILRLIHDMNEPIREVMYLRLISNLSFAEIGEIIGKTENWTRVTFFRGKQKIVKEMLKDE